MGAFTPKLVRDRIPDIIRADGQSPVTRILDDEEYRRALLEKLVEEATELLEGDGNLEERADVAEVLRALDAALGYDQEAVEAARAAKVGTRGGFEKRIMVEKIDER